MISQAEGPAAASEASRLPIWKDTVFWFVIAFGLGYGAVYNFLPATFPVFKREFASSLAQMGQVQFLYFLSGLAFSLVGGSAIALLGLKSSALGALGLVASALLLIAEARNFNLVLIAAAIFGFAIAGTVVISSSIVTAHFRQHRQSIFFLTGLSDAGGSMIGPALLGWWLVRADQTDVSWRLGYLAAVGGLALLVLWTLLMRSDQMEGPNISRPMPIAVLSQARDVLTSGALYIAVVLGFCHGLAHAGMFSFVGQLFIHKLHIDAARAAYFISVNAGGILAGRTLFSWISSRWKIPELVVITVCAAVETMAFLGCIFAPSYAAGMLMFILAGIFVSSIGPSLNSYLGGKFPERAPTAFSLFAGLSNVGAAIGPFLIGKIGNRFGVEKAILFGPAFSAVLSGLALVWFLRERMYAAHVARYASALPR